jgi:hypothetical protein
MNFNVKFNFENDTKTRSLDIIIHGLHTLTKQFRASLPCNFINRAPFMRTSLLVLKTTILINGYIK